MNRLALFLMLALALYGCVSRLEPKKGAASQSPATVPRNVASNDEILAFLKGLKGEDYHDLARTGEDIFKPGLYIPDYARIFENYRSENLENGIVRYDLYSIKGEAGAAFISLFLQRQTGRIEKFSAGEAIF